MRPVSYDASMPAPVNGLATPAASPTTRNVGPAVGCTDPPIGTRPTRTTPGRCGRVDLPSLGEFGDVSVEQMRDVGALEVAGRAEQTDTDVDGAVADRGDPAVARQRLPGIDR